ncbi:hypothetical protein, partial [Mesorhizobium sp.]|uniref:hypothetical protein n=1 Tax=Mesorhizobium sp. TaxID=1871066 RepID=UPI0011F4C777
VTPPHKGEGDCAAATPRPPADHWRLAATPADSPPPCGEGLPRRAPASPADRTTSCIRTEDGTVILFDRATGRAVSGLTRAAAEAALLRLTGAAPEQFREKCEAVFRPELRQNNEMERFAVYVERRSAPGAA